MKYALIGMVLLCMTRLAPAQASNLWHYSTEDGLPGATVYRLAQSKEGYIWIATDYGLSRFDGHRFTNYDSELGLP